MKTLEQAVQTIEAADLFALREFLKVSYAGEGQPQFTLPLRLRQNLESKEKEKPGLYAITHVSREGSDLSFELRRRSGFISCYDLLTFYFSDHKFLNPNTISVKRGDIRDTSDVNLVEDIGNRLRTRLYRTLINTFESEFG